MTRLPCTLLLVAATLFGCATTKSAAVVRADELESISAKPLPKKVFEHPVAPVTKWQLTGPLPTTIGHTAPTGPGAGKWETLLSLAADRSEPSQALRCVANERARFALANAGEPPELLAQFINSRCGVPSLGANVETLSGPVDDRFTDDEIFEHWQAQAKQMVMNVPARSHVGIAYVRQSGKAMVVVAHVVDRIELEPVSMAPQEAHVVIRGKLLQPGETVFGAVNHGAFGSAECAVSSKIALPQFELDCVIERTDASTWLSVGSREHGRWLGNGAVDLLLYPRGELGDTFVAPKRAEELKETSPRAFTFALNRVRQEAGLKPVELAEAQSSSCQKLAPHYFVASYDNDAALLDRIAMGLAAGWYVKSPIGQGDFTSGVTWAAEQGTLLAQMLESPHARRTLLSPEAGVVAFGAWAEAPMVGAVVTTYPSLPDGEKLTSRQSDVFEALNRARAKLGVGPVQRVVLPHDPTQAVAERVRSGAISPKEGLERLLNETVQLMNRAVQGWHLDTPSLERIEWPNEMLTRPNLQVMLALTTAKTEGEPFTRYHLLFVLLEGANTTTVAAAEGDVARGSSRSL